MRVWFQLLCDQRVELRLFYCGLGRPARAFETKMYSSLLAVKGLFLHHLYSFLSRCNVLQLSVKSRSETMMLKASASRLLCFSHDLMSSLLSRTELKFPNTKLVCSSCLYLVMILCI